MKGSRSLYVLYVEILSVKMIISFYYDLYASDYFFER